MAAIGVNWKEVWSPVWKAVWTQVAPSPTPSPAPPSPSSGGYFADLDALGYRYRAQQKRNREERQQVGSIEDRVAREIAQLLREQQRKDEEREELARIQALADRLMREKTQLPRPILAATMNAYEARTVNALEQFQRVVARHLEEEEAVILAVLLLED